MEMHQIRYFLAVAREGNFTRAARDCNVSQPSLSRAIKHLEREFGGQLFFREPDNIRLTELGQIVEPFLRATHDGAASARSAAKKFNGRGARRLRLGIMCTIAPEIFTPLLVNMRARHPDVALSIRDGRAADLRDKLLDGRLDAVICANPDPRDEIRLHAIDLYREQMVVVTSTDHALARRPAIDIAELNGVPYVARENCEFKETVDALLEARGVDIPVVFRSERDDWVQTMVAAGVGFGFMPSHCVTHPCLSARPLQDPDIWRDVRFLTVRGRVHKAGLGALVREVAAIPWRELDASGARSNPEGATTMSMQGESATSSIAHGAVAEIIHEDPGAQR